MKNQNTSIHHEVYESNHECLALRLDIKSLLERLTTLRFESDAKVLVFGIKSPFWSLWPPFVWHFSHPHPSFPSFCVCVFFIMLRPSQIVFLYENRAAYIYGYGFNKKSHVTHTRKPTHRKPPLGNINLFEFYLAFWCLYEIG